MKKKITITVIAVLLVITLITGFTYAYWRLTYTQTGVNKVMSSCFSMELANEKNNITLDSAYPISDEKGKSLTPYSFTITNTCDLFASYTINLEMLSGTTLNSKYVKTMVNSEAIANLNSLETTDTSIEGATESRVLFKGSLGSGDSTDYTLRIWMDSETPPTEDTMNKIFQGKITVTAEVSTYSPAENGFTNLAEALLVNEYQTTNVDVAKNKIASKQEVDTTKTAPIIEWKEVADTTTSGIDIIKASSDMIGSNGIVEKTTQILLGKSYEFDSTTGYYKLTNTGYYDPTSVDFTSEDYYFCNSTIGQNTDNNITYWDAGQCSILKKIKSLHSVTDRVMTLNNGDKINAKKYTFVVYGLKEEELESDKSDKGLYKSQDDHGTTYYYRGNVANNYVKFANHTWRIVRINGDGSVRLLYNGANSASDIHIGKSAFNGIKTDPTYIGYMYSNNIGVSYEETIRNDNDSTVKTMLDNWYETNIDNKGYSKYIADSGFCNDRTKSSGDGYSDTLNSFYIPYGRQTNATPTFKCENIENDLFTLNTNEIGNKALTYPIGLITVDELMFSGFAIGFLNKMNYTYSNSSYWTMTPLFYRGTDKTALLYVFNHEGSITYYDSYGSYAVRPVINLKSNTKISGGIGTVNDPFIVE